MSGSSIPPDQDFPEFDPVLGELADLWDAIDPVPSSLVSRVLAVAGAEVELAETDFDYELMMLVERSNELAGARGSAYTLRFSYADVDLLVRAGLASGHRAGPGTRLDGWVVPPDRLRVSVQFVGEAGAEPVGLPEQVVDENGRFEFTELPSGLVRLWLRPEDDSVPGIRGAFATPAFEI